jgi:cell division protein FtsN
LKKRRPVIPKNKDIKDTRRSINEHKKKRFPGSAGYALIPFAGIVLAVGLFYASRDIFFDGRPDNYERVNVPSEPAVTAENGEAGAEKEVAAVVAVPDGKVSSALPDKVEPQKVSSGEDSKTPEEQGSALSATTRVSRFQDSDMWGIQLAMSTSRSDCERLANEVRKKGYNPQITRPGEHYRVRVNGGQSRESALEIEKMLKAEGYDTLLVYSGPSVPVASEKKVPAGSARFSKYQKDGTWGVQVGMFPDKAGAMKVFGEIKEKGFNPEITRPGKYYRVRIKAGSEESLAKKIEDLLKKEGYDTLLVRSS